MYLRNMVAPNRAIPAIDPFHEAPQGLFVMDKIKSLFDLEMLLRILHVCTEFWSCRKILYIIDVIAIYNSKIKRRARMKHRCVLMRRKCVPGAKQVVLWTRLTFTLSV